MMPSATTAVLLGVSWSAALGAGCGATPAEPKTSGRYSDVDLSLSCKQEPDDVGEEIVVSHRGDAPHNSLRLQPRTGAEATVQLVRSGPPFRDPVIMVSATRVGAEGEITMGPIAEDPGSQGSWKIVNGSSLTLEWRQRTKRSHARHVMYALLGFKPFDAAALDGAHDTTYLPSVPIGAGARWARKVTSDLGWSVVRFRLLSVEKDRARLRMSRLTCLHKVPPYLLGGPEGPSPCEEDPNCFHGFEWIHTLAEGEVAIDLHGIPIPSGTVAIRSDSRFRDGVGEVSEEKGERAFYRLEWK